jgi:hypothetical protein
MIKIVYIKGCGGKKGKGSCGDWAGATNGQTTIKIAA